VSDGAEQAAEANRSLCGCQERFATSLKWPRSACTGSFYWKGLSMLMRFNQESLIIAKDWGH